MIKACDFLFLLLLPFSLFSLSSPALAGDAKGPEKGTVLVAVIPPDGQPSFFQNKATGKPSGFAVEVMGLVAERAGLQLRYEFVPGWAEIIKRIEQGAADISPGMAVSKDRQQKHLDFTEPIEIAQAVFFVRATIDRLGWKPAGHTVGVIGHSVAAEYLAEKQPDLRLVEYRAFGEGLFDLLAGQVDAFAGPVPIITRLARESGVEDRIMVAGTPILEVRRAIAVRKGNPELRDRLNKAVAEVVGGPAYQRSYEKWYGKPKPFWTPRRIAVAFIALASVFVFVTAMIVWRNRSLAKVNRELQEAVGTIKTLHGILPICASCKKIRDDKGSWHQLEIYIRDHTDAEFTHGLCAECMKKLYPQVVREDEDAG